MPRTPLKPALAYLGLALTAALAQSSKLPGQYLLKVNPSGEELVVSVGAKTWRFPDSATVSRIDLGPFLKAGPNKLTVAWRGLKFAPDVAVAYATTPGQYRTIFDLDLNAVLTPKNGSRSYTIVADGPLSAGRVSSGSADDQTVMKTNGVNTTLTVTVNGIGIGDYPGITSRDVSRYLKPGANTVKVGWSRVGSGPPIATLQLAHAAVKNQFRTIFTFSPDLGAPARGEKTLTVNVPSKR